MLILSLEWKKTGNKKEKTFSLSVFFIRFHKKEGFSLFRFASSAADRNEKKNVENGTHFQDSSSIPENGKLQEPNRSCLPIFDALYSVLSKMKNAYRFAVKNNLLSFTENRKKKLLFSGFLL